MSWTPLEFAANIMTAICIFLAGRNNIHTWWTGIVASILFGILFFNVQLYADATLQLFFIWTGITGYMVWNKKVNYGHQIIETPIRDVSAQYTLISLVIAAAVTGIYGSILYKYTDAYAPWVDSGVLTLSVLGQLLLMDRYRQTWLVWLAVNTLSVPLFWSRELYLTSILYGFFWVNAIVSYINWTKLSKK